VAEHIVDGTIVDDYLYVAPPGDNKTPDSIQD
jgi:hypothetical protein